MARFLRLIAVAGVLAAAFTWWMTGAPDPAHGQLAVYDPDIEAGQSVFLAAGCASCHKSPGSQDDTVLAGGAALQSDFGTFYAPNISSDPTHGIGGWSRDDFAHAVRAGVSPSGRHYYPAFPYASYSRMTDQDVVDLWAFMQTLPADQTASRDHDLPFPVTIRRGIGVWKALYLNTDWAIEVPASLERGQYLVEALGHCAECHTPRGPLGALDVNRWMAGAPNPSGTGSIPALTPDHLDWLAEDVAYYLETGFTPDFDSAGGSMAAVVRAWSQLPVEDRDAVGAYIAALPPSNGP